MINGTLLRLYSPSGIPLYAARGAIQTYAPIEQASINKRSVLGTLVNMALPQFQKYRSTITCTDMRAPILQNSWPGTQVVVDCLFELSYKTEGGSATRIVVEGSERTEGDLTYYRPRLTMHVINFEVQDDEWNAAVSWTMELEEV